MAGKAWIGVVLAVVFAGSVSYRHVNDDQPDSTTTTSKSAPSSFSGGNSFAPSSTSPVKETVTETDNTDSFIAKSLPFVTEASFFGLLGFALGYFSKKVVKLMMIFIAILFIAMQVFSYIEVVQIDWQKLIDVVNGMILNLKENDSISAVLKDRIPTAGALVAGYFVGFRKG
ncbi:MAG: putative membrane protein (Fun14 family) [Planctomycetota bacterium]|jgi:uncharacterized membrane protein (Fun14 family)